MTNKPKQKRLFVYSWMEDYDCYSTIVRADNKEEADILFSASLPEGLPTVIEIFPNGKSSIIYSS